MQNGGQTDHCLSFMELQLGTNETSRDRRTYRTYLPTLTFHSDFFSALFSSNFKEGAMNEVPIKDIFFKDFGLLMSTIYPKNVFPNDTTVEKLLELADRFIMPSVFRQVENHLISVSQIENEKKMWMADKYSLHQLLKKTIHQVDTIEKAKKLKISSEYAEMSDGTKAKLFERLVQII